MATDRVMDGDYLGAYSRFFSEFVARVNPDDQLPVKVSTYDVTEGELVGEIISVTLQYLNQTYCPPSLQSYIVHLVIEAIKLTCKKQPEICGLRQQEKTYAPLKLMQAVTNEVNEICRRYLDNSRLALLPPPSSTPQVTVGAIKNARRKMEDRHVVLHDLHTIFNIQDDTTANYYAVFDGHGGQDAAAYCATHLHQYLVESVHYPTDPERALRDAFITTDEQFIAKSSTQKLNGGTTAVCALILNKKLYVAWVGDSMASLVAGDSVAQLVNPHRPARKDECERIQNMGGAVLQCMGVLRVNGFLSISRAIGDVPYKPYISGEPEVRCVSLDGTEDFLILACDGLWDYVDQRTAALRVYGQVLQNPHDLKYVHQALLQSAKRAGSLDNITVIVIFLTPPEEIASRNSLLSHRLPNGLLVNNMDPNNPFSSNSGQFDVNAAFIKQQQQQQQQQQHQHQQHLFDGDMQAGANYDFDDNHLIFGKMTRNGKHADGDGNDDDYDYTGDLGPETDVDACEDMRDIARFPASAFAEISPECEANVNAPMKVDGSKNDNNENNDYLNRDNANVRSVEPMVVMNDDGAEVDNRYVRSSDVRDVRDADDETAATRDNKDDDDDDDDDDDNDNDNGGGGNNIMCVEPGTHTVMDDDESPPSPRATKPLQHALIPEADNVADSEDSEDEWNYYRIDPNKKESAATTTTTTTTTVATDESHTGVEEHTTTAQNSEPLVDSLEVRSSVAEDNIKYDKSEKETTPSPELINVDISDAGKPCESKEGRANASESVTLEQLQADKEEDMDFQLNPEAAEFVPLSSPPLRGPRNFLQDYPISGSPLRQTPAMDDIPVPTQSEFEEEVCRRPREVDESDFLSEPHAPDHQKNNTHEMDVSEVSSTKAEMGDESMARIMSSTQWQTDLSSQWSDRASAGSECEEYANVTKDNPMTMSYTPGDFESALGAGVDLNAVHDLNVSSDSGELANTTPSRTPEPFAGDERARTPLADEHQTDFLRASSTPHNANEKSSSDTTIDSNAMFDLDKQQTTDVFSELKVETAPIIEQLVNVCSTNQTGANSVHEFLSAGVDDAPAKFTSDECKSASPMLITTTASLLSEFVGPVDHKSQVESNPFKAHDESLSLPLSPGESVLGHAESSLSDELLARKENADLTRDVYGDQDEEKRESYETGADEDAQLADPFSARLECTLRATEKEKTTDSETPGLPLDTKHNDTIFAQNDLIADLSLNANAEESRESLFSASDVTCPESNATKVETTADVENKALLRDPDPNRSANLLVCDSMESLAKSEKEQEDSGKLTDVDALVDVEQDSMDTLLRPTDTIAALQEQPKSSSPEKAPLLLSDEHVGQKETGKEAAEVVVSTDVIAETFEKKLSADVSVSKEDALTAKDIAVVVKSKKISKVLAGVAAGVAAGTAASVASVAKSKTATTTTTNAAAAKRSTKVTGAPTKTATKPTPTSPSKTFGATARATPTSQSNATTARKPAASSAARPKQLDGSTKPATSVAGKSGVARMTTTSSSRTATTATKSASPRVLGTAATKPKATATPSPRSATGASTDRKPTASGDARSSTGKPATTKPASAALKTTSASSVKATSVRSSTSTTRTSMSTVTSKPRPLSATAAAKTTSTTATKQSSTTSGTSTSRPKTAPVTSACTSKPREGPARTATAKSPMTDKQSKETVNKQISRAGLSAPKASTPRPRSAPRAQDLHSGVVASGVSSTAANVKRTPGKSPASNASATSPTKKLIPTSKVTSKVSVGTKKTPSSETKVLQNGIVDKKEDSVKAAVITAAGDKPEDDIPRKDTSPLDVPTDNQLITD